MLLRTGHFSDQSTIKDDNMPASQLMKLRWFRFSLATFLFVSLCIDGLIGGYQSGYRQGYIQGQATRYNETQVVEQYDTSFLIWPDLAASDRASSFDSLKDLIQSTICTDIWGSGGNVIEADPFGRYTMFVTASGKAQKEIRDLLSQLEGLQNRGGMATLLPIMQGLASQGVAQHKSQDTVISIDMPKNSIHFDAWFDKYFALTVEGVSKQWGTPRFQGQCSDPGFPEWSLDQRIATWSRGGGLSYFAARRLKDGQLHIAAGWRERS